MNQQKKQFFFLILSFLTVFFLILTGISVAERSLLGFLCSLLGAFTIVGIGFVLKRKWRKEHE